MDPFFPHADSWPSATWQDWIAAVGPELAARENPRPLYQAADTPPPSPLRDGVKSWHLVGVDELAAIATTTPVSLTDNAEEEIATVLAALVQIWRENPAATLPSRVILTSGTSLFHTIAKLRAFRLLSTALAQHCTRPAPLLRVLISVQGDRAFDAANALVRMTVEAVAGILGLADELEIPPIATGEEATWRALAVGHVIREEAALGAVADPTAGSYFIESLTADLARAAWSLFRQLETGTAIGHPTATRPPMIVVGVTHFQ